MKTELVQEVLKLGLLLAHSRRWSGEHSLKTAECPSIPEFDRLARPGARWTLRRLLHTNTCRYCQLNLALFRRELDIKPWWEVYRERWLRAIEKLQSLAVPEQSHLQLAGAQAAGRLPAVLREEPLFSVPAVVVRHDPAQNEEVSVAVTAFKVDESDCLWLNVVLAETTLGWPVELTIVDAAEGTPIQSFILPKLPERRDGLAERPVHELYAKLPAAIARAWRALATQMGLPFRFIIRSADAKVEEV